MATEIEIRAKYLKIHNEMEAVAIPILRAGFEDEEIGKAYKAAFDFSHGENYRNMEAELIAEGYRKPPEPVRDLAAEIDEIKEKVSLWERR